MSTSGQELVAKIVSSNDENASKPGKAAPKDILLWNGTSAECAVNRNKLGKIIYIVLLILAKILGFAKFDFTCLMIASIGMALPEHSKTKM